MSKDFVSRVNEVGLDEPSCAIVPDIALNRGFDALESDVRRYLISAALIEVLEAAWVFLALPGLVWSTWTHGHTTLAAVVSVGWLVVAAIHCLGMPFSHRDRQRGRALLRRLQDLHVLVASHPVSPARLQRSLDQAAAAGVALDGAVFSLVDRVIAGAATATPMAAPRRAA
jgi:hypothetical protein